MKKIFLYSIVVIVCLGNYLRAEIPKDCPATEGPSTAPSKVNTNDLINEIAYLKDINNNKVLRITPRFKNELRVLFKEEPVRTKMDQFYRMLYYIHAQALKNKDITIELPGSSITKILIISGVFRDDTFPRLTKKIELIKKGSQRIIKVYLQLSGLRLPLNNSDGFYSYEDGKCQHLTHLLFDDHFSFEYVLKKNNNLIAKNFKGVYLFGDFGTRGFVDIDLNYIQLEKVEFIDKTTEGYVTARIAEREFKEKQHSWFLKLVNKFYSNTTRQPIDW